MASSVPGPAPSQRGSPVGTVPNTIPLKCDPVTGRRSGRGPVLAPCIVTKSPHRAGKGWMRPSSTLSGLRSLWSRSKLTEPWNLHLNHFMCKIVCVHKCTRVGYLSVCVYALLRIRICVLCVCTCVYLHTFVHLGPERGLAAEE